jgi:RNA polymerase sigma-70 factor (ECF subfamily)
MQADSDTELVRQAIAGSAQALTALARRYYRPVGAFLLKRVQQPDLVEDLVQETFLEAFRSLRQGRPPEHFSSWLFGIAHNRWGKWVRRRRPLSFAPDDPPAEAAAPAADELLAEAEDRQRSITLLQGGLAELPEETRRLLRLKHQDGKTCEEIAGLEGKPVGTIKSLLSRAYKTLRERLGPPGGPTP